VRRDRRAGPLSRVRAGGMAACARPSGKPATPDALSAVVPAAAPDSVRLRPLVQQAVEARVAANPYWKQARGQVGGLMSIRIIPSGAVPGLSYAWGFFVPPNTSHVGPFAGVVGVMNDSARILEDAEDWASLVGSAWAPRGPEDAIAACVEVTGFIDAWASRGSLYSDTASALFATTWPHQVDEMKRRLTNPSVERTPGGGWEVDYWVVPGCRSYRHRCLLHPGAPPATAVQIAAVDTADVGSICM
jgi:hypothetical protein